jgi:hypothetical protein
MSEKQQNYTRISGEQLDSILSIRFDNAVENAAYFRGKQDAISEIRGLVQSMIDGAKERERKEKEVNE